MSKILAMAGSGSTTSINHLLILNVIDRLNGNDVILLKLHQLNVPMYSPQREQVGIPQDIQTLYDQIREFPALIFSVNEYNSNVSGFFKNIIDWLSRVDRKFLAGKKILLMSTSNGSRGGAAALEYCKSQFARFGGDVVESFSLPNFAENFDAPKGEVVNEIFDMGITEVITSFSREISE